MGQFLDYLTEAGKTPVEINWIKRHNEWSGSFIIKEQRFEIEITIVETCNKINIFQFKFFRDKQTKLFNDMKYPFQVYPTIKTALEEFVKTEEPDAIVFAAVEDSKARKEAYKLEGGYLAHKYNYFDVSQIPDLKGFPLFGIYKKQEFKQCVFDMIGLEN